MISQLDELRFGSRDSHKLSFQHRYPKYLEKRLNLALTIQFVFLQEFRLSILISSFKSLWLN